MLFVYFFFCYKNTSGKEAFDAGKAPYLNLEATHIDTLKFVKMEDLLKYDINNLPQYQ